MLEQAFILYNWLALSEKPQKADSIFLFGSPSLSVPEKGLELYKKGFAPYIVVTGERSLSEESGWDMTLADKYAEYLRRGSVPQKCIIIQNKSVNTLQDVTFSLPILVANEIPCNRVILVNRPFQQRRCNATFRRQSPTTELINVPCDTREPIDMSEVEAFEFAVKCVREYEKIQTYADKGDIERQHPPEEVREAYRELKEVVVSPNSCSPLSTKLAP